MIIIGLFVVLMLLFVFLLGNLGIICGIVGLSVRGSRRRNGLAFSDGLTAFFIVILVVGIVIASIPVGIYGMAYLSDMFPPADFVETAVVVEEYEYVYDEEVEHEILRITADGVVYEEISLMLCDDEMEFEPIFSYMPEGVFNRSQWCNFYAIPNEQEFSLITDGWGTLLCPVEEKEAVFSYYENLKNQWGYFCSDGEYSQELTSAQWNDLKAFLNSDWNLFKDSDLGDIDCFWIETSCKEHVVYVGCYEFMKMGDTVYFVYESEYNPENDRWEYTLAKVPNKIAKWMLELYDGEIAPGEADNF